MRRRIIIVRKIHSAIALLLLSSFMAGCNQVKMETGDFIFDKQINQDKTPMIAVVQNISRNDASNHSLSDYLNNDDPNDVIYYHITDADLYEDLEIGERVTVTAPHILLSSPLQAMAIEVVRHDLAE